MILYYVAKGAAPITGMAAFEEREVFMHQLYGRAVMAWGVEFSDTPICADRCILPGYEPGEYSVLTIDVPESEAGAFEILRDAGYPSRHWCIPAVIANRYEVRHERRPQEIEEHIFVDVPQELKEYLASEGVIFTSDSSGFMLPHAGVYTEPRIEPEKD